MLGGLGHKPLTGNISDLGQNFVVKQQRQIIDVRGTFYVVRQIEKMHPDQIKT